MLHAGLGAFAAGLGMWDKALFVWMASGAGLAALVLYWREMRAFLRVRMIAAIVVGFGIGAAPLIVYNIRHPMKTFQGNFHFAPGELRNRAQLLEWCLSGAGLDGYIPGEEWRDHPRQPRSTLERASVAMREIVGERRITGFFWIFAVAALSTPLWPRQRRAMAFALITMSAAWLQMAINRETGGGVHHVVLLWPAPQFIVGAAVAGLAEWLRDSAPRLRAPALAALLAFCCAANLAGLNQYFSQFVRMGAVGGWTDAIFPLADYLWRNAKGPVFASDWGMVDALVLLHGGKRIYGTAEDVLQRDPNDERTREILTWMLSQPGVLFLTHTPKHEFNEGNAERLNAVMRTMGYEGRVQAVINDSNGRAIFEVVQFSKHGEL
jgi:hypothetical protein